MKFSTTRFSSRVACIATALVLALGGATACGGDRKADSQSTESVPMSVPAAKPTSGHILPGVKRNKTGELACVDQPVVEIANLDDQPAQTIKLQNNSEATVKVTEEGLEITANPDAMRKAAVSILINHAVGVKVTDAFTIKGIVSDTALLTREGYGPAHILTLCPMPAHPTP